MSSPPVSKHTPLPTSVTFGAAGSPQVRSIRRGARAAARPTAWISGKFCLSNAVADGRLNARAMPRREVARGLLQLGGPEIVRRRVDQIARERHAVGDAREVGAVDALGNFELRAARIGLAVARELVAAEREGQRGKARIVRRVGEAIGAGRQQAGQAAGQEAVLLRLVGAFQAEQDAAQRAIRGRQQQRLPGLRLELRGLGEAPRGGGEPLAHLRVVVGRDEPDRNRRCAVPRDEGRMHGKSPRGASCYHDLREARKWRRLTRP